MKREKKIIYIYIYFNFTRFNAEVKICLFHDCASMTVQMMSRALSFVHYMKFALVVVVGGVVVVVMVAIELKRAIYADWVQMMLQV